MEDELTDYYSMHITRYQPEKIDKLVKTSKFNKKEIQLIYRAFKQGAPTGLVDEEGFKHIFSQFFPLGDANAYAHHVFNTFKHNHQGQVCFEDFLAALSTLSRGTTQDKIQWIFGLYDVNRNGFITKAEMVEVVEAIYQMLGGQTEPAVPNNAATEHVEKIFPLIDSNKDGTITMDELVNWVSRDDSCFQSLGMFDTVFYTNNKDHLRDTRLVSE